MRLILIIGGASSGKSFFAEQKIFGRAAYLATAKINDSEMAEKVERHRERRGSNWTTFEEFDAELIRNLRGFDSILLDSLTLWISGKICAGAGEESIIFSLGELLGAARASTAEQFIIVSDEVGMSLIPENKTARRFREVLGRANQLAAQVADEVYLVVAGLSLRLK